MLPIRTILHPTDFSERSEYALRLACALARDHGSHLVILHVASVPVVVYGEGVVPPDSEDYRQEKEEQLKRLTLPGFTGHASRRVKEGDPAAEILGLAQDLPADLIVMGTHGRTGLERLLMGSVAEQVVRKAPCPVLTVKTPFPEDEAEAGAQQQEAAHA